MPVNKKAIIGNPKTATKVGSRVEIYFPVSCCFFVALLFNTNATTNPITNAATVTQNRSSGCGFGMYRPRLFKTSVSKPNISIDCFGLGKLANAPRYQNIICNNRGVFLRISTYHDAICATSQFRESLNIPTTNPSNVARTIERPARIKVLIIPTQYTMK